MEEIKLPELGEDIEKATVACFHCNVGDHVNADDDIVEVVTDKATFNVPTKVSGNIINILVAVGQEIKIGQVIAHIDEEGNNESENQ
ncbi:MAG: biotin/lipoyl-binding protein [Candidatus Omnitrophica bacterium]|nr:biotin/lipoyl-binding protein [Candidatus Omnitrophota bacterium]MBU1996116.1 biotin/lipoyl-binding protein [Candidatus Omnitrophota bacterium]MBU4333360.1 biotin/lipoyl-binding protein [Candidatus Omnitrophota bacterium]